MVPTVVAEGGHLWLVSPGLVSPLGSGARKVRCRCPVIVMGRGSNLSDDASPVIKSYLHGPSRQVFPFIFSDITFRNFFFLKVKQEHVHDRGVELCPPPLSFFLFCKMQHF